MKQRERLGLSPPDLPRWSLPIVSRLATDRKRFSPLRASLAPITPRALSLTLQQMLGADLVDREVADDFPPIAIYGLTGRGMRLAEALR
jgi:DNA-binding HxlR family transcriptional regulator